MVSSAKSIIDNRSIETIKIDNRYIDRVHNNIRDKLQDDSLGIAFTKNIIDSHFSEADIMNVVEYCQRKASQNKGRAFVKIFTMKMAGQL